MRIAPLLTGLLGLQSAHSRPAPRTGTTNSTSIPTPSTPASTEPTPMPGRPQTHSTASYFNARNRHGPQGEHLRKPDPTGPDKDVVVETSNLNDENQKFMVWLQVSQAAGQVNWSPLVQEQNQGSDANLQIGRG